jgi:hypothetical protein
MWLILGVKLPYLHWETNIRRAKMAGIIREETLRRTRNEKASKVRRLFDTVRKAIKTKLGDYLFNVAKVANAIDIEPNERQLRTGLYHDPPMHIRRTLDQSYFLTLDTEARDRGQVVRLSTAGEDLYSFHSGQSRVIMVDQLWLWILDEREQAFHYSLYAIFVTILTDSN